MVAEESDNLVIFISSTDAIKTGNKIHYYLLITKFIIWSFENIVFFGMRFDISLSIFVVPEIFETMQ